MRHCLTTALLGASLFACVVGCAPTANGVWRPALPWTRGNVPLAGARGGSPVASNPWQLPNSQTDVALPQFGELTKGTGEQNPLRLKFLEDMMKRANAQEQLAENQRKQLEQLRLLQDKQQAEERQYVVTQRQKERDYITTQRKKERDLLERQFAEKEKQLAVLEDQNKRRMAQLRGQSTDLDQNNRELHAQLSRSEQRSQVLQDEINLLKKQLGDTTRQLTQTKTVGRETGMQLQALQASVAQRRSSGASITANSSLKGAVTAVMVPGMDIRQDGDLVRMSIPADKLFMQGTASLHQGSQAYMDQVAQVITQYYPRQTIGVEAHTDHGSAGTGNTQWRNQHQITAAQSMAVFEQLTNRSISAHQMFVIGHGGNHPFVSDATPEGQALNRRVEIVVYPETQAR